jgi:hypothetical protein
MEWTWSWKTVGVAITEKLIRSLAKPRKGAKIYYDNELKGLGISVSTSGNRSFILSYTIHGRARRMTIGQFPVWSIVEARDRAARLRLEIDNGHDPLEDREEKREAWTVSDLAKEYHKIHVPNLSPASQKDVGKMWECHILPFCGSKKLADLTGKDIDDLHRKISEETPVRGNRVLEVFRHSLNLAIRWGHIERNPANRFKRNVEQPKENYLTAVGNHISCVSKESLLHSTITFCTVTG